jgi:RNA ligase (TIGR02306 family)
MHEILVVKVNSVVPHPNADSLDLIQVDGFDYNIISRRNQFQVGDLGVYIEPDYVVSTEIEDFAFLGKLRNSVRITNKRLRGLWSDGLLIPAKSHHVLGQNVMEEYKITRWEPPVRNNRGFGNEGSDMQTGWQAPGPEIVSPKYDLENFKKYSSLISEEDVVYYTVKIHGCNGRFVYSNGQMYCGSRTTWKYKPGTVIERTNTKTGEKIETTAPDNSWWNALSQNEWLEEWCRNNPDSVVYGEVFGSDIQGHKFHYGYQSGSLGIRIFDVLENSKWIPFHQLISNTKYDSLSLVPSVYFGPHNKELLYSLIEENETSLECGLNHIREGIVIKLQNERIDFKIGRVALKCVGRKYLERS